MSYKCQVSVLLVMALLGGVGSVSAQDGNTAAELKKLQEQFEAELENLKKPGVMLQDKYRGALTKQKGDYQAAGQLKAMLAVDSELQALESGSDAPLSDFPEIKRLQEIYRSRRSAVQAKGTVIRLEIIQSFRKSTTDLAAKLTQEGKIEEAKFALAEVDRLEAIPLALTNSLDMKFVSVPGTGVLFCIHEVRRKDFAAYAEANPRIVHGRSKYYLSGGEKEEDYPMDYVSWNEARDFCLWLSKKEGLLYRLPTDEEWSMAVGIGKKEDRSASPEEKSGKVAGEYPWGSVWPPPQGAGNYSDQSRKAKFPTLKLSFFDHDDGFPLTAPVMSFKPNQFGLFDLGGNVEEWVEDKSSATSERRVLRGGSCYNTREMELRSSYRDFDRPTQRVYGFRCVVSVFRQQ